MMFKSSTYTVIIINLYSNLFINTHGHTRSFLYPSLNKYLLRHLFHISPDVLIHTRTFEVLLKKFMKNYYMLPAL
ncbi:uncharacterized protein DS421_20g687470 [Arachis hypogaea]|nr:uncharacterized protein DS421_20g687470 [Arachis hypogaea]